MLSHSRALSGTRSGQFADFVILRALSLSSRVGWVGPAHSLWAIGRLWHFRLAACPHLECWASKWSLKWSLKALSNAFEQTLKRNRNKSGVRDQPGSALGKITVIRHAFSLSSTLRHSLWAIRRFRHFALRSLLHSDHPRTPIIPRGTLKRFK